MALEVFVEADGSLRVMYRGGEEADATPDNDESVQDCVDTALEGQGTEAASDELRSASFAMSAYSDNFASQRTQRQGEIIGLYTLSGVSLGLGIGSLIAAGGESGGDDEFQSERVADASSSRSREQLPSRGLDDDRVSTAAFIGAEVLYIRNKRIERDENPGGRAPCPWARTAPSVSTTQPASKENPMNARLLGWSAAALFSLSACSGLTGEARTDHTNCMQGSYGDCISLADRYQDGDGVEADADRAAELYLRACRHKASLGGCTALAALAGDASLTSITIEDAEDALWSVPRLRLWRLRAAGRLLQRRRPLDPRPGPRRRHRAAHVRQAARLDVRIGPTLRAARGVSEPGASARPGAAPSP